jgi:ferric-dicitrate binding protein FerR (iron transport regulator)
VVGTKFSVYSRYNNYIVTCYTGKVEVSPKSGKSKVLLTKGQQSALTHDNKIEKKDSVSLETINSWLENKFSFENMDIKQVFEEIGRQYNIKIKLKQQLNLFYTGNFQKDANPEQVLTLVCKPLGLEFTRTSTNEYQIKKTD